MMRYDTNRDGWVDKALAKKKELAEKKNKTGGSIVVDTPK